MPGSRLPAHPPKFYRPGTFKDSPYPTPVFSPLSPTLFPLLLSQVVKPSSEREDASMRGDALVVGEKAGPPGTPTVLFYASYGTVDESKVRGFRGFQSGGEEARSKFNQKRLRQKACCLS